VLFPKHFTKQNGMRLIVNGLFPIFIASIAAEIPEVIGD
jgi:hypothetical protein